MEGYVKLSSNHERMPIRFNAVIPKVANHIALSVTRSYAQYRASSSHQVGHPKLCYLSAYQLRRKLYPKSIHTGPAGQIVVTVCPFSNSSLCRWKFYSYCMSIIQARTTRNILQKMYTRYIVPSCVVYSFSDLLDSYTCNHGAVSIRKTVLPGMAIPMLKIRRPNGRLIFNMEITIRR